MSQPKSLVQVALVATLIIVLGFLPSIPLGIIPVPIVLQNMGVMLAATVLGRRGSLSVLLFLILGFVFPVFTGGNMTLPVLTGPTAGYVLSWLLVPVAYSGLTKLFGKSNTLLDFAAIWLAGVLLVLLIGASYLAFFTNAPLTTVFGGNLIFIPGDTIKAALALLIAKRLPKQLITS